jgi:hypothetical protein
MKIQVQEISGFNGERPSFKVNENAPPAYNQQGKGSPGSVSGCFF